MVNSGKALHCLEASSLNVQNDIADLCACTQTAQTSTGLLAMWADITQGFAEVVHNARS